MSDQQAQQQQPMYIAEDPHTFGTINGVETEWSQIHRKLGNIAPKPERPPSPPPISEKELTDTLNSLKFNALSDSALRDASEDVQNEDERKLLEEIRHKRLREMREKATREKFGQVREIGGGNEYIKEVTEASKLNDGTWVVCHLFSPDRPECKKLHDVMTRVAYQQLQIKFVRIRGNLAIRNFPEKHCPSLLIYYKGEMKKHLIGLKELGGMEHLSADNLEAYLANFGAPVERKKTYRETINEEDYLDDLDDSDFED
mmetsp:Transcript_10022/g.37415  ORF Transcript_10022/g.37415 Transcript_10022/m.37415 type:complete len:258 (-) Transcript_10022:1210-1983(-)|eukprot:CAMPEP_0117444844 /NCGR_PEP_ID=MMETSP0759-20121206/5468_1 /TAXON_ID=63605 /ORGANISM="Percolomonas cosmopolitus, Strain WS" /LENGTH=257 /DNA_ID=CAMNT_0005236959 /DNA_START=30 /DNA_END=803 /DNA_ORIENTATION=-